MQHSTTTTLPWLFRELSHADVASALHGLVELAQPQPHNATQTHHSSLAGRGPKHIPKQKLHRSESGSQVRQRRDKMNPKHCMVRGTIRWPVVLEVVQPLGMWTSASHKSC